MKTKPRNKKPVVKELSFSSAMQQYFFDDVPLTAELSSLRYDIKPSKLIDNIRTRIPGALFQNIETVLADIVKIYGGGTYSLFIEAFHGTTGEKVAFTKVENIHLLGDTKPTLAQTQPAIPQPVQPAQNDALEFMKVMLQKSEEDKKSIIEMMNNNLKMIVAMKQPTSQRDSFKEAFRMGLKFANGQPFEDEDDTPDPEETDPIIGGISGLIKTVSEFAPLIKNLIGNGKDPLDKLPPEMQTDPRVIKIIEAARETPDDNTNVIDVTDETPGG